MQTKRIAKENSDFFRTLGIGLLCLGLIWFVCHLFASHLITMMYQGKSFDFLNRVIKGQDQHGLDYYTNKAGVLFYGFMVWSIVTWIALLVIIRFVRGFMRSRRKVLTNLLIASLSVTLSIGFAEVLLRTFGFKPWPAQKQIRIEPGGRWVRPHPVLGYSLIPGKFKVTFPSGYSCTMTHSEDGHRITHPPVLGSGQSPKGEIWVFGCSFTYSLSLNDDETYAWQLQERLPEYEIINFGVSGYGTLQALLQFREALKRGTKPRAVIYAYASFHDERNTFLTKRRVAAGRGIEEMLSIHLPYVRFDREGKLIYLTIDAKPKGLPFVYHSALMRLLEEKLFNLEDYYAHSHEVTKVLIRDFHQLAQENGVEFAVAGIDRDSREMLRYLRDCGIKTVDISVNLDGKENRNWPHDSHPNAQANQKYAENLERSLKQNILIKD